MTEFATRALCRRAGAAERHMLGARRRWGGFTLVEPLVVVGIVGLLFTVQAPAVRSARPRARGVKCVGPLRSPGHGLTMYGAANRDVFVPGRMPKVDDCEWFADVEGGRKYRPTLVAMMRSNIGIAPFEDPRSCKSARDRLGKAGGRQNCESPIFVRRVVRHWTGERNGSYSYNYQFLGTSRLRHRSNRYSFKNWPAVTMLVRAPSATVAVADCMGTAASFPPRQRRAYEDDARGGARYGNEGFNLDPPRIDSTGGEMTVFDDGLRAAADPRHRGRAAVPWVDTHADVR